VATNDVIRQDALARIDAVQALVHALPVGSPIAAVLTDAHLQEQRKWVEDEANLENAEWPPLLGWTMAPWRANEIALLDSDIQMVRDNPTSDPVQATAWLSAKRGDSRKLRAGLVETTAKARALAFADGSQWEGPIGTIPDTLAVLAVDGDLSFGIPAPHTDAGLAPEQ
jgi:hypothetical protein